MDLTCIFVFSHIFSYVLYFLSYLGFSAFVALNLRTILSLFFSKTSSVVKPWLPFSTVFCSEEEALP